MALEVIPTKQTDWKLLPDEGCVNVRYKPLPPTVPRSSKKAVAVCPHRATLFLWLPAISSSVYEAIRCAFQKCS